MAHMAHSLVCDKNHFPVCHEEMLIYEGFGASVDRWIGHRRIYEPWFCSDEAASTWLTSARIRCPSIISIISEGLLSSTATI